MRLDASSCISLITTSTPEILVVTNKGVISKTVYISNNIFGEVNSNFDFSIGAECRFKDNKTSCEEYYQNKSINGVDVIHDTLLGLYWQQNPILFN